MTNIASKPSTQSISEPRNVLIRRSRRNDVQLRICARGKRCLPSDYRALTLKYETQDDLKLGKATYLKYSAYYRTLISIIQKEGEHGSGTDHREKTTGFGKAPIEISVFMLTI